MITCNSSSINLLLKKEFFKHNITSCSNILYFFVELNQKWLLEIQSQLPFFFFEEFKSSLLKQGVNLSLGNERIFYAKGQNITMKHSILLVSS